MPTMTIGPLRFRRWLGVGQPVCHGPVQVRPVAQVTEITWHRPGQPLVVRLARPHHVRLTMLVGTRRIPVRPPTLTHWPVLLARLPLTLLVVGSQRDTRRSPKEARHGA